MDCKTGAETVLNPSKYDKSIVLEKASVGFRKIALPADTHIFKLHLDAKASLGSAGVKDSVKLPLGVSRKEWIAAQMIGIYEEVGLVVNVLEVLCTHETCPHMLAGKDREYFWMDDGDTKQQQLSAPKYTEKVMAWAHGKLSDKSLIPDDGTAFPEAFENEIGKVLRRLFRVYAHTYIHHFGSIKKHGAEGHLNLSFKHYLFFVLEFDLVPRHELLPLAELIERFEHGKSKKDAKGRSVKKTGSAIPDDLDGEGTPQFGK